MLKRIVCFATLFCTASSFAFYPVDGFWYNSDESGRGLTIEMQDDVMVVAIYHYDDDGNPLWWLAAGDYDHESARFQSQFDQYSNGQCVDCPYNGRPTVHLGQGGSLTIDFHSAIHATMHWNGGSTPIHRHWWRFSDSDPRTLMLGEFHLTTGALGLYFGDIIRISELRTLDGEPRVVGHRTGAADRILVGGFGIADSDVFSILVDSSSNFYKLLIFDMTKDRIEGASWTYRKDESPTGSGLPLNGHRMSSRSYVETGNGPHGERSIQTVATDNSMQVVQQRDALLAELNVLEVESRVDAEYAIENSFVQQVALFLESMLISAGAAQPYSK